MQQRRVSTWKDWATGQGGEEYERLDLPLIAYHLHEWWSVQIPAGASVNNIPQDILDRVKEEIVQLLEVSCLIKPHKEPSIVRRVSVRGRGEVAVFDPNPGIDTWMKRKRSRPNLPQDTADSNSQSTNRHPNVDCPEFTRTTLKELFGAGKYQLIGMVELLLEGVKGGLSCRAVNEKIKSFGGSEVVDNKLYETASKLEKKQLTRFQKNITEIRKMMNAGIPAHVSFRLHEDVKIVKYFADGERYSSGDVLPRKLWEKSRDNPRVIA
jgi:hypothetical protein